MRESEEINFYNGGELNYTVSDKSDKSVKSILLINCDTRNEEFTVRIQL